MHQLFPQASEVLGSGTSVKSSAEQTETRSAYARSGKHFDKVADSTRNATATRTKFVNMDPVTHTFYTVTTREQQVCGSV